MTTVRTDDVPAPVKGQGDVAMDRQKRPVEECVDREELHTKRQILSDRRKSQRITGNNRNHEQPEIVEEEDETDTEEPSLTPNKKEGVMVGTKPDQSGRLEEAHGLEPCSAGEAKLKSDQNLYKISKTQGISSLVGQKANPDLSPTALSEDTSILDGNGSQLDDDYGESNLSKTTPIIHDPISDKRSSKKAPLAPKPVVAAPKTSSFPVVQNSSKQSYAQSVSSKSRFGQAVEGFKNSKHLSLIDHPSIIYLMIMSKTWNNCYED